MKIFTKTAELQSYIRHQKEQKKTIGFVPTMGALHDGHLSLLETSKKNNAISVVSIFVNPTQFDNPNDFDKYPNTLENDQKLLKNCKCDAVFIPSVSEIYKENIVSETFNFDGLEHQMEGKFRKGHFDGVGTIVKTLFEIVTPYAAYFGEKDFQQLQLIKKMVEKTGLPISVIGCPIFREKDGLAMSSRNVRLLSKQRKKAPFIYETLQKAQKKAKNCTFSEITTWVKNQFKEHPTLELEYFSIAEETTLETAKKMENNQKFRAFIAVFAGEIRLIDNLEIP